MQVPLGTPEGITAINRIGWGLELLCFFIHIGIFAIDIAPDGTGAIGSVKAGVKLFLFDITAAFYLNFA